MSQQINLINFRLRPRRDWLDLRLVLVGVALVVAVEGVFFGVAAFEYRALTVAATRIGSDLTNLKQQVETLDKLMGERKPSADLMKQLAQLKAEIAPREQAVALLKKAENAGFAEYFVGLSRQSMDGVWLTEFSLGSDDLFIRGRLLDHSLLPAYVKRLNSEPTLRGRRFAALDMKGVEPGVTPVATQAASTSASSGAYYVEFALHGTPPAQKSSAGG